jgi:hypothetical protein
VKEDFATVRMDTPAELILARGSSRRRRRRRAQRLAMASVFAAGLGLAVSALTSAASAPGAPAGHQAAQGAGQPEHTGQATLAAWTVVRMPDGSVAVTIYDLRHIAGLQQRLNAADAHTLVYADLLSLPGCLNYQDGNNLNGVVTTSAPLRPSDVYFVIHPAVIPQGSTLQVDVLPPGSPLPQPAPHQHFPSKHAPAISAVGFGPASAQSEPNSVNAPFINLSLIYTNSNCS